MSIPNRQSSLPIWIDWLLHLYTEEIDLELARIRSVAERMQVMRPAPVVISVAGTNGKGSSVAILVSILRAAGYKVGAYTSPHIRSFNERIQIDGTAVRDVLITTVFDEIESARLGTKLTYFEFATLAACTIFSRSNLDVAVLEVGLGGRLDAVNIIDADAALITAIGIDHVDWLGSNRSVIATEKAGIMRMGKPAVCSDPSPPESLKVYAIKNGIPLSQFKVDFDIQINKVTGRQLIKSEVDQTWSIYGIHGQFEASSFLPLDNLPLPALEGGAQLQNAAGVVALLGCLSHQISVNKKMIIQGLKSVCHPCRLELRLVGTQSWLIDVAHNPQSAQVLAEFLGSNNVIENGSDRIAIFSALIGKNVIPMVKLIAPFVKLWLIADLSVSRSTSLEGLKSLLMKAGVVTADIREQENILDCVKYASKMATSDILVWGSFLTVAQTLAGIDMIEAGVVCG